MGFFRRFFRIKQNGIFLALEEKIQFSTSSLFFFSFCNSFTFSRLFSFNRNLLSFLAFAILYRSFFFRFPIKLAVVNVFLYAFFFSRIILVKVDFPFFFIQRRL